MDKDYFWRITMNNGYIQSGNERLHYLKWGSRKRLLLAFHGYSNQASMFGPLASRLTDAYTTISIDMPHHGLSAWSTERPWTKKDLVEMVRRLMKQQQVEKVSLVGFSLGGRVCLMLAELMPEVIEHLTLIAPDGLVPSQFYKFVTANIAGRRLFSHFLEKPEGWMRFFNWLQDRKMLHPSKRKFVEQYVAQNTSRAFLKKVWPNLRLLVPDQQEVRRNIAQYNITTHLFMGRHDQVIPLTNGAQFVAGAPHLQLHILEKGHRVMDEGTIGEIAQSLLVP